MNEMPIQEKSTELNLIEEYTVRPMTEYHLRPKTGLNRSQEALVVPDDYLDENAKIEGFAEALNTLKQNQIEELSEGKRAGDYPKIVFLGTGSCIPNKTRNASAILVHITYELWNYIQLLIIF